ncbi:hypothetical protein N656DRAFT_797300 [Canariomyces notabilis]|uniref:Uncharacterized protein n=1 Tax=Canariomyces notabilis TaxID=2074819 RepID=A0AAN6TFB2_9PEZI|nr:hypothetical protein N656DRAFT_797300 [Canariomyces arenarius]
MSGDSEWKSADQGEKLKLLLEESRSDSEKAAMLIELLETGFFNANSQLESEDDSGDGVEEVRLPSSASDPEPEIDLEGDVGVIAGAVSISVGPRTKSSSLSGRSYFAASRRKAAGKARNRSSQFSLNDDPTLLHSRPQPVFESGGNERKIWLSNPLSWVRKKTLNLSRRLVHHLEKFEEDPDANVDPHLAYGEFYAAAVSPRDEPPKSASPRVPSQSFGRMTANDHIPSATGVGSKEPPESSSRGLEPDREMGGGTLPQPPTTAERPSEFEALLRAKVFKPFIKLTAFLPEPHWDTSGQFIAEREREVRETLKEVELGVGINVSGFGVEVSSKGFLPLVKPYQWINMWRNVPREMYVCDDPSEPGGEGEAGGKLDMEKLHELENELMSSVKYQCGQSEYMTVITYSDDVKSGAVALLKAEFGSGRAVTGLRLEARFKDMPREVCRMLARDGNPNRIELRRVGRTLSCRARGKQPAPRPVAVVSGRKNLKEWTSIGRGWRKALHITLHDDLDCDLSPREGLVATVPQMLALLHLSCRAVDFVPSTPIFSFEPPLSGKVDGLASKIRRGIKLLGPPSGAPHVGNSVTIAVLFSRESRWVTEQLFWA